MWITRASHCHCATLIFQAIVGFVLNLSARSFFFHASSHPAALDHKVINHAMKDRAVVVTAFDVL